MVWNYGSCDQLKEEKEHAVHKMTYLQRKWQVLMWKNLIVRKRHWFLTLFELVIPILLFWVVAWIRQNEYIGKAKTVDEKVNPLFTGLAIIDYSFLNQDKVTLAYAPDTDFTRRIVAEMNKTLTTVLQNTTKLDSFNSFETEQEMEQFFHLKFENKTSESNYIGYGIVFENVLSTGNGSDVPKDFKYKIRSTVQQWNTKEYFPQFIPAGPSDESDDYFFKGFLSVQIAVDNAYIAIVNGEGSTKFSTAIQKFPFPEYKVDIFNEIFKSLMPFITMLSFITISISVLKKVVEEKESGVKELMQMMGLKTWMVWAGWVLNGLMVYLLTCAAITFLLCYDFDPDKGPVIAHVQASIVFVLFTLFCVASIFLCFAISSFFMKPTIAMSAGMTVWVLSYSVLQQHFGRTTIPIILQLLFSMVPIYNMCTGYVIIAGFESRGVTINWLELFSPPEGGSGMSLGLVMIMFFMEMIFYMAITWYITSIHPGPYGRAEPWYFIFTCLSRSKMSKNSMLESFDDDDEERYEAPPKDLKVGLKIQDLRKVFSNNVVAVDKVNLDIYEGQITALLGHNGAGKTTTMSILTGMYSPTSGAVYAKDYNIFADMDRFRNSLGLCPQHDLLFPYLTALQHLIFFGMLKGMKMKLARSEGIKLLNMLHMNEKKNILADKLSGGMKRKLSLAIALIGSPQVLVLDEPTSGMDPESRREMWDLLLKLRGERTVLITTHFMEEADVLGDRIAIMDHGKVKCYGTTLFLKRIYGTGYQLTLMKDPKSPVEPITETVKSNVMGAELKTVHSGQVTYKVPQEQAPNLSPMFAAIEDKKTILGIKGMGISCTTMEEVFLKVGELAREEKIEFDKTSSHSAKDNHMVRNMSNEALTYKKHTGMALMWQQFKSLVHKRSLYTIRRPVASLIFFVLPLLLIWLTVRNGLVDLMETLTDPPLTMHLNAYGQTDTYFSGSDLGHKVYKSLVTKEHSKDNFVPEDMIGSLLKIAKANIAYYKTKVIVAADFNTTTNSATALYSGMAFHSAPISVNLVSNTLLRSNATSAQNTITTTNHPLNLEYFAGSCSKLNEITLTLSALMWLILVPMGVKGFLMDFIAFPHRERTTNAKQLQLMTGVPPPIYWLACFTWDYFVYLVSCASMFTVIVLTDTSHLFSGLDDYGVFLLILMLYGVSGISCTYIYSFISKSSNIAGSIFTFKTLITGMIAPLIVHLLVRMKDSNLLTSSVIKPLNYILCLEPQYAFGSAIFNYAYLLSEKSACSQCDNKLTKENFCSNKSYLEWTTTNNPNGILQFVIFLALDWMLYVAVIMLIEYGYASRAAHWIKVLWVGKDFDKLLIEDEDVKDERDRVDASRITNDNNIVLTVDGLAKKFSRSFAAVQGVSFRVSAGECFGLLGVNGAGKTTTFRMLTGDENPTAGSARLHHYDLVNNKSKYLSQIGYCPQFDGINGFLTGEEVLRLFANLRGIPERQMQMQIDDWINLLGLEEYRHRLCWTYSGGNKRKLSTAMALVGDPPVVFLDEPTTGVDPVARRNLWDTLARCQKAGQAIVLTSHSMEECEALCTRLTIMVRGRMKCIGSNQYLKQRYGQGYTLMVKLHPHPDQDRLLVSLKKAFQNTFTFACTLKDEHKGLLNYHMTDTNMPLSQLFSHMETLKKQHAIIEDYTVSDTTLEQVFIAFARQAEQ